MENNRGGNIKLKDISVILIILIIIPIPVSGDEEFKTSSPDYLVGDFLEYKGYSEEIFSELKSTIKTQNQEVELAVEEENNLKIEISSFEECEIKEYEGLCQRGKTNHFMNISIKWPSESTNYLDDKMYILITTSEESLTPKTESPWSWTKRIVIITSIFNTDNNEIQSVERRISEEIVYHRISSEPEYISVGDSWVSAEKREIIFESSYRENYGLWDKTISNSNETIQRIFNANSVEILNNELGTARVLSISEGDVMSGNYSIAYLDELGFNRRVDKYTNGNLEFTSELIDYRYLKTPDPSAQQSVQTEAICFGVFIFSSLIFIILVFGNEFRNKRTVQPQTVEINLLDEKLLEFNREKQRKYINRHELELTEFKQNNSLVYNQNETELKSKLRSYYLKHNPAKLEFLNEIVRSMEENDFGKSEDHMKILNLQLIEKYGIDLDGNQINQVEKIELPNSSKKFKEFMESILED